VARVASVDANAEAKFEASGDSEAYIKEGAHGINNIGSRVNDAADVKKELDLFLDLNPEASDDGGWDVGVNAGSTFGCRGPGS